MKKNGLIIALLIMFLYNAGYSQDSKSKDSRNFKIGLKLAPGIAWLKPNSENLSNQGAKLGFSYGLVSEFYFTENYGIATGIDVSYNGGHLQDKTESLGNLDDMKYKLQYIEIPFTLKMKTKEYGYLSYFGQFGIGTSYNLKAVANKKYSNLDPAHPAPADVIDKNVTGDDIRMFRSSFIIAIGAEYSLTGNTRAFASLGFNNGLTNIMKLNKNKAVNNYVSLNLGILF